MSNNCVIMVLTENGVKRNSNQITNDTFYCPVMGCKYNFNFGPLAKSFRTQKLLKQVSQVYYNAVLFLFLYTLTYYKMFDLSSIVLKCIQTKNSNAISAEKAFL